MKYWTRPLVLLLAAAALAVGSASSLRGQQTPPAGPVAGRPGAELTELFPDTVIAKGQGVKVMRSQLDDEVIRVKGQYAAQGRSIPPEQTHFLEQKILADLIQAQLLKSKTSEADRAAGKELAAKEVEQKKTQCGSDEALDRQLKAAGFTRQEWVGRLVDGGAAETFLKRELKVNVTDEEVKKYYDDHPSRFERPEMVHASHILFLTADSKTGTELSPEQKEAKRKQLEDVLKRARAGEDFAKLAREYSEDTISKDRGGELPPFFKGQMTGAPEFEAAAWSLTNNQVSDIVVTKYGYHIIKLLEHIPHKQMELKEVAAQVKDGLTGQVLQEKFVDYYRKLREDAKVAILDDKLKPVESPEGLPAASLPASAPAPSK